jgi:hypothetical protein
MEADADCQGTQAGGWSGQPDRRMVGAALRVCLCVAGCPFCGCLKMQNQFFGTKFYLEMFGA